MTLIPILSTVYTLCTASYDYLLPGDNSHYIEGVSRYIWLPDDEGLAHLVDLQEPMEDPTVLDRSVHNNRYWLYTRSNRMSPQEIVNGNVDTICKSNYNANKPLMVIVHGWKSNADTLMNILITATYLSIEDANVILVDWQVLASSNYITACYGAPNIGEFLGKFLIWLIDITAGDWSKVHLVGFSLGAHIAGIAGQTAGGWPGRVTVLDPAGPLWVGNAYGVNKTTGQYVEVIHTDSGVLGIRDPIGHADFYPNGGRNPQPGCWISTCSHRRAIEYFASSLYNNHFIGSWCPSITDARHMECFGHTLNMGNSVLSKHGLRVLLTIPDKGRRRTQK